MTFDPIGDDLIRRHERALGLPDSPFPAPVPFPQPDSTSAPSPAPSPAGVFLSDLPAQPLTWLWPARIPLGHLTLLDAAPGCDLSLFALTLAACVSNGSPLPDGTATSAGHVILITPYDSPTQTLRPRLEAAGADLTHILLFRPPHKDIPRPLSRPVSFPADLDALAATIQHLDARLVIIDPACAIPGLPRCLPAIAALAQQFNCAILLTRSLTRPPADPLRAPAPASPLLDAAHKRLLLIPDPTSEHCQLLLTTDHPLAAQPPILAYDIQVSETNVPTLHCLGQHDGSHLARLCTGPLYSAHRQAILRFLRNSPVPCEISDIIHATSYDYEAGRKMIVRMRMAGELVSLARGLYTTAGHPCLASLPTGSAAVTNVPTSPDAQSSPAPDTPIGPDTQPSPVTNVPIDLSLPSSQNFIIGTAPLHYISSVPDVPNAGPPC